MYKNLLVLFFFIVSIVPLSYAVEENNLIEEFSKDSLSSFEKLPTLILRRIFSYTGFYTTTNSITCVSSFFEKFVNSDEFWTAELGNIKSSWNLTDSHIDKINKLRVFIKNEKLNDFSAFGNRNNRRSLVLSHYRLSHSFSYDKGCHFLEDINNLKQVILDLHYMNSSDVPILLLEFYVHKSFDFIHAHVEDKPLTAVFIENHITALKLALDKLYQNSTNANYPEEQALIKKSCLWGVINYISYDLQNSDKAFLIWRVDYLWTYLKLSADQLEEMLSSNIDILAPLIRYERIDLYLRHKNNHSLREYLARHDSKAQFDLGLIYQKGFFGLEADINKAIQLYDKAAQKGNISALLKLAQIYYAKQEYEKAALYHALGANQGNAVCQFNLGYIHQLGLGVEKNMHEAVKWYTFSAQQGYVKAQDNLKALGKN